MPATINLSLIDQLKGADDYDWKFTIQSYLEHADLWNCIVGDEQAIQFEESMVNQKAKLILALDKSNFTHIRNVTMPKEIWDNLKTVLKIQFSTTDKKSRPTKNVIYKKT